MKKVFLMLTIMLASILNLNAQFITCDYDKIFILYGIVIDSNLDGELNEKDDGGEYKAGITGMLTLKYEDFDTAGNILQLTYSTGSDANKSVWENVKIMKDEKNFLITDCLNDMLLGLIYDDNKKAYFLASYNIQVIAGNR